MKLKNRIQLFTTVPNCSMTEFYQNKKPFSRLSWIFILMIFAGMLISGLFSLIGSSVDDNGMLQEPFFLLGIGYFLMAVGIAGLVTRIVISLWRDERNNSPD